MPDRRLYGQKRSGVDFLITGSEEFIDEIDLNGDTWLSIRQVPNGRIAKRVRVSKALLSFASPYFRVLFGPRFLEGPAADNGKDIEMLEEKTLSFVTLMQVLHMRSDFGGLTVAGSLHFAMVVDKYDCTKAIKLSLGSLLPVGLDFCFISALCDLVNAAYLLDSPQLFTRYTADMVINIRLNDSPVDEYLRFDLPVPCATYLIIERRRSMIFQELHRLIHSLIRIPCANMGPKCPRALSYHLGIHNALEAVGLDDVEWDTAKEMFEKADKLVLPIMNMNEKACDGHAHREEMHPRKAGMEFRRKLQAIRANQTGLCIDCVKAGRWNGDGVDCRCHESILGNS